MGKNRPQKPPGLPETKHSESVFQHQGPPPHCKDQSVTTELSIWVTKTWLCHRTPFASSLVADVVNGGGRKERARAQKQDWGSGLVFHGGFSTWGHCLLSHATRPLKQLPGHWWEVCSRDGHTLPKRPSNWALGRHYLWQVLLLCAASRPQQSQACCIFSFGTLHCPGPELA